MYTKATYTKPEDMYKCYELARLLNEGLTKDDYKTGIDSITKTSNYTQHVLLHDNKPVSMVATQDVLMMGVAPKLSCKMDNVATLPEHRGFATKILMEMVKKEIQKKGYGNINVNCSRDNERANRFYEKSGLQNLNNGWVAFINTQQKQIGK